jgi:transcription termination/antitermination protein NusG
MNRFAGQVAVTLIDRTARINLRNTREIREEEQPMTADSSGMQEPEEERFKFSLGQGVRIIEGPFTEYVGTISRIERHQKKVTVLITFFGRVTPMVFDFLQVEKFDH